MSNLDEVFYEKIKAELDRGYSFTPLVGSGISYQSGIMLGSEIGNYLCHVYCLLFSNKALSEPLEIQQHGWPDPPSRTEYLADKEFIINFYISTCARYGVEVSYNNILEFENYEEGDILSTRTLTKYLDSFLRRPLCPSIVPWKEKRKILDLDENSKKIVKFLGKDPNTAFYNIANQHPCYDQDLIQEIGLRSLNDWRATLNFISRLSLDLRSNKYVLLKNANDSIIDSFNRFLVSNKKPNQNHHLLVKLSPEIRIKKILTTNFDGLLEDAYRMNKFQVEEISVEKQSELPSNEVIGNNTTVIKLHGNYNQTRSDFSLDDTPSVRDKHTFLSYFYPTLRNKVLLPSHLLVIGTSLIDLRTRQLIEYCLRQNDNFKVFIICTFKRDIAQIKSFFPEKFFNEDRIIFSPAQKSEYCLYELYQHLTLALPPGGSYYEFDQHVPPIHHLTEPTGKSQREKDRIKLLNYIVKICSGDPFEVKSPDYKLLSKYQGKIKGKRITLSGKYGISKFMASIFFNLSEDGKKCLWFETEDYANSNELYLQIIRAIYQELGQLHQEHIQFYLPEGNITDEDPENHYYNSIVNHMKTYLSVISIDPADWNIFIFDRNGMGNCAGVWPQDTTDISTETVNGRVLGCLDEIGFRVIHAPLENNRKAQRKTNLSYAKSSASNTSNTSHDSNGESNKDDLDTESKNCFESHSEALSAIDYFMTNLLPNKEEDLSWEKAISNDLLVREQNAKLRFLYVSSLFRYSRHISALLSEAAYPCPKKFNTEKFDNDLERAKHLFKWRNELISKKIFLTKPGGYSWKYGDVRKKIRDELEKLNLTSANPKIGIKKFRSLKSKSHYYIADWYFRAFMSSYHATPLQESIYHSTCALEEIKFSFNLKLIQIYTEKDNSEGESELIDYRLNLLITILTLLTKIFQISSTKIKYWQRGRNVEALFDLDILLEKLGKYISNDKSSSSGSASFSVDNELSDNQILGFIGIEEHKPDEKFFNKILQVKLLVSMLINQTSEVRDKHGRDVGRNIYNTQYIGPHYNPWPSDKLSNESDTKAPTFFSLKIEKRTDKRYYPSKLTDLHESFLNFLKSSPNINKTHINFNLTGILIDDENNQEKTVKTLVSNIREMRDYIISHYVNNPSALLVICHRLTSIAQVIVRHAKIVGRINERHFEALGSDKILWVNVCCTCSMVIELTRFIPSTFLNHEINIRSKTLCLYGLALGRLHRFKEAHRRLNEASSLNINYNDSEFGTRAAAVFLRRAEVYLEQSIIARQQYLRSADSSFQGNKNYYRNYASRFEDVLITLNKAESYLSGVSQSSYWWGRLYMLKLRLYSNYEYSRINDFELIPGIFKSNRNIKKDIYNIFLRGWVISSQNSYRKLCFVYYFLGALTSAHFFNKASKSAYLPAFTDDNSDKLTNVISSLESFITEINSYKTKQKKIDSQIAQNSMNLLNKVFEIWVSQTNSDHKNAGSQPERLLKLVEGLLKSNDDLESLHKGISSRIY